MGKAIFSCGKSSIELPLPVYLKESYCIGGTKEAKGPLGTKMDCLLKDDHFGQKSWEDAECCLQKEAVNGLLRKAKLTEREIRYVFAGDLLGQTIASSFGLLQLEIPHFGLYGACSTCGEALTLGAMTVGGGFAQNVLCVTSSHFASAEKEFRFPLEYGGQRPESATWTVTGSGAFLISSEESVDGVVAPILAKITGATTGNIVDLGVLDSMNMGCAMAPAAAQVIKQNFEDFQRTPEDYDVIVTGDLGEVGSKALLDLLLTEGIDLTKKHQDCGLLIYDQQVQNVGAGGSGCACSALTLASKYLPLLREGSLKRILFVPTGALLSKTSFHEGKSVPGIAHAVVLERI